MIRTLVAAAAVWLVLCGPVAAEMAKFSTPAASGDRVEAEDKAVALSYDENEWTVTPRPSKYRMFAMVEHADSDVAGMLIYRGQGESEQELRDRVTAEMEMMDDHSADFSKRIVNGVPVLHMKATAKKKNGSDLVVRSYYWMSPNGVVDYAVMGSPEEFEKYGDSWMELLNGLEISTQRADH